jgi:hypothetical protein
VLAAAGAPPSPPKPEVASSAKAAHGTHAAANATAKKPRDARAKTEQDIIYLSSRAKNLMDGYSDFAETQYKALTLSSAAAIKGQNLQIAASHAKFL